MVFAILEETLNIVRIISSANENTLALKFSHIPSADIYTIAGLAIIGFVMILIIDGYQYSLIRYAVDKKEDLPGFGDTLNLLANGVKYFMVCLIYNIIPIIVVIAGFELQSIPNGDYIILFISMLLFIICNFLLIMALANMIDSNRFMGAFDLKEIIGKISDLGWIKYVGIILFAIIVYFIVMFALGTVLMFFITFMAMAINHAVVLIAILSVIEGLFINSYMSVFFNRVYGSVYNESVKL